MELETAIATNVQFAPNDYSVFGMVLYNTDKKEIIYMTN